MARDDEHGDRDDHSNGTGGGDEARQQKETEKTPEKEEENSGTLILDATCAPQAIRFPTDTSLLDEARRNTERIIDALHKAGLTEGKTPRTYRTNGRKR